MNKLFVSATMGAFLMLSACASTNVKSTTNEFVKKENAHTLMVVPDVELKILMASGMTETRAEWSKNAQANLASALQESLEGRSSSVEIMDPNTVLSGQQTQMLKLTDAVMQSALAHDFGPARLPNKKDIFDRTIGPGAKALAGTSDADYALMTTARGSYQSTGKAIMNIATAALVGYMQNGQQTVFLSLVDLDSGDIVWSNYAIAAAGSDMRKPEGAQRLMKTLLKDFPL